MADDSPRAPDSFEALNPADFVIGSDYAKKVAMETRLTVISVSKPDGQSFVRCRPGTEWSMETYCFKPKGERRVYFVRPEMWDELRPFLFRAWVVLMANRHGGHWLWPVRLPKEDGAADRYADSCMAAAKAAQEGWVQIVWDDATMAYQVNKPHPDMGLEAVEPEWPTEDFFSLVGLAFRDQVIGSPEHPEARKLRGG